MTSDQILTLVQSALAGNTDAGANVFTPGGIPTWDGDLPVLLLYCDDEQGQTISGTVGYPQFDVVSTVKIEGRVQVGASNDDAGTAATSVALGTLRDQIKAAVINGPGLMAPLGPVQAFRWFRATKDYSDAGTAKHVGQITVEIGVEHYQGADDFFNAPNVDLRQVHATVAAPDGTPVVGADITALDA